MPSKWFESLMRRECFLQNYIDLENLVLEIGFLPLFHCEIPGFSAEDLTLPGCWFTGEDLTDPWEWRKELSRRRKVAYGKFFGGKAGFISREWFPSFANYRRDGYDFDARWEDELASIRSKKIMDLYAEENQDRELFSYEVKDLAGFGKTGEKNFEGEITRLQMLTYLCIGDFRQKVRKDGKSYGWGINIYCTPEHLFGEEDVKSEYQKDPGESWKSILERAEAFYPGHREEFSSLLGIREEKASSKKGSLTFPENLVKAMKIPNLTYADMTAGQRIGLGVALSQLQRKHQRVLRLKYQEGKTNEEIGQEMNKSAGTISTYHRKAMSRLKLSDLTPWYQDSFNQGLVSFLKENAYKGPMVPLWKESQGLCEEDSCLALGISLKAYRSLLQSCHVISIRDLKSFVERDKTWWQAVSSVGQKGAGDIERKLELAYQSGFDITSFLL